MLQRLRVFPMMNRMITRLRRSGFYVLLGFAISLIFLAHQARASGTVVLQFRDRTLPVPLTELQAFAENTEASPEIQGFLQEVDQDPAAVRRWLNAGIIPPRQLRSTTRDFALTQVNKIVGNPLGRSSLEPLQTSFSRSLRNDNRVSILELVENHPGSNVRLELSRLERVYGDVDLVLTRIEPVLQVTQSLLSRVACDCSGATAEEAALAYSQAQDAMKTLWPTASTTTGEKAPFSETEPNLVAQLPSGDPALANRSLIIQFGLLGRSIPLQDLTRFAETGELSSGWRTNFNLAGVNPENVRTALNQQVSVDMLFLDRILNNLLGEYFLFQIGQVVGTQAGTANIQAMRSALVLSAADDNRLSLLEVLQRYPTPNVFVDVRELARFGRRVSRFSARDAVQTVGITLEDWLLELQGAAIANLCTCEDGQPSRTTLSVPPPVAPTIAPDRVNSFLPPNWQPIPAHREDRGIIRVVWLQGTPYEMGYQHGEFLRPEIASLGPEVLGVLRLAGKGLLLGEFSANRSYPNVVEECRGLTDATQDIGMTLESCLALAYGDVLQEVFGNTLPNVLFWDGCSQWVATGAATVDGRLYHGSTLDNGGQPIDYIVDNPVVFIRQPNDGLPHVFITYPGVVWPNWGLNVAGITMGLDSLHPRSPDYLNLDGRSDVQIMAQVLRTATSFTEAREFMVSEPSARANLIMVADGKSKEAGVFEIVGNDTGVRELQENGVLYVTNHIELPEMYERQRLPVNEASTTRFDRFAQLMEPDGVSTLYGRLDAAGMVKIGRDRTDPRTMQPSPFDVFDDDASPGGNGSLRQGVYDPDRLLFWVAAGRPPVPENPFVCFSLGELLAFPNATPCESPSL